MPTAFLAPTPARAAAQPRRARLSPRAPPPARRAPPVRASVAPTVQAPPPAAPPRQPRVVLVCGFETFNLRTYTAAAERAARLGIVVDVFTDVQLEERDLRVADAVRAADVVFSSLIFDYDQVEWLRALLPRREDALIFVFESALELMQETRIGSFNMAGAADPKTKKGMPPAVKFILQKLGLAGREEDKLAGYLALLKGAPKFLRLIPGRAARDLRHWLRVYLYWNAGGTHNVVSMLRVIVEEVLSVPPVEPIPVPEAVQVPNIGLCHPDRPGYYFEHPREFVDWYFETYPKRKNWKRVGVLLYRKHVVSNLAYVPHLIRLFEEAELVPIFVFITGVEAHIIVRDFLTSRDEMAARDAGERLYGSFRPDKCAVVDAVVSTLGFSLVGGPAGSMAAGRNVDVGQVILRQLNVPYMIGAPLLIQDLESWNRSGVAGLQSVVLYALPELDGAVDTVISGGLVGDEIHLIPERVRRLTGRLQGWISLRSKPNADKVVAIVLYGYPPSVGATGTAALLNVPQSLKAILTRLGEEGYDIGEAMSLDAEEILRRVKASDDVMQGGDISSATRSALEGTTTVGVEDLAGWLGEGNSKRISAQWGDLGSPQNLRTVAGLLLLGGVRFGNVWVGVQPPLGVVGDPMRLMFERDLTPHPQYVAFYQWLEKGLHADAVVHVGTHGTVEWLPGNALGNSEDSWSDICIAGLPNLYVYTANNPSEAMLAKRRGYATIVSHNVPPYGRTVLYGKLEELKTLIQDFQEAMQGKGSEQQLDTIRKSIESALTSSGIEMELGIDLKEEPPLEYVSRVSSYLKTLESRLFSSGLHVFGRAPSVEDLVGFVEAILDDELTVTGPDLHSICRAIVDSLSGTSKDREIAAERILAPYKDIAAVAKARTVAALLKENTGEMDSLVAGLNGEFIEAVPGGDVLRDGAECLPTGRNIHSLDPYRMPSPGAYCTGRAIAENVISMHRDQNGGAYPETVAVPLWGIDNIKTKGESVGIALGLLGAVPVKDGTGRVVRFDLLPLEELGRPRIDVLLNLSGIFRDSFSNTVVLLDDVCRRAASADETENDNFVRKHAREVVEDGDASVDFGARLFSNPPADYGSMVNEQVADGSWESGDELAQTFMGRNSFSYGRKNNGQKNNVALRRLLSTTSRVVQQIDSVEFGLSDIQEYYANTGALLRAARIENPGASVGASIVESFGAAGKNGTGREPKELEQVLREELRTRLLNPAWASKMLENGAGGAFEVSTRMTALIGWGGTAEFGDDFVFEQAAERYVLDEKNREIIRQSSAEAYRNILSRFLEASGRGIWKNADPDLLEKIRDELSDCDAQIEGV